MKNLKKVLSLALVFAMVLGLCIGAMAADTQDVTTLTDWGNVAHKNAAQLLNAFNIMQGYPDKTFRPGNTVTRAEAVKMIDVGLWGGIDQADRFVGSEIAFSDVKSGDWYAGHVVYAEALGILDGFPDGTFRPNETVTGYQMLKMALIALNYNSEVEGLTGSGWDIRTMRLATDPTVKNLTDGLSEITNWNAPLTRDQAAQIIYNMIMHGYVTYNLDRNGQVGNMKTFGDSFGKTFLGMDVVGGTLIANAYANISGNFTDPAKKIDAKKSSNNVLVYIPAVLNSDGTTKTDSRIVEATLESTLLDINSPVTLYYKGTALVGAALNGWTEVEPEYDASYNITNYEDGHDEDDDIIFGNEDADYIDPTYVDTDGDGDINYVIYTCYGDTTAVKVEDVTATTNFGNVYQVGTIKWRSSYENGTYSPKNFIVESEANFTAKKGDIIAFTTQKNVYDKNATYGIVLDPVDGAVSRVVNTTTTHTVTVDGTAYPLVDSIVSDGGIAFGAEGTFYLYPDDSIGKFVAKTTEDNSHYALVYDAAHNPVVSTSGIHTDEYKASVQICAILDDGTSGVYTVNAIYDPTNEIFIPVSAFTNANIDDTNVTIKVNGTDYTGVTGFFATNGVLTNVDNHNTNSTYENKLVKYTLNEDGSMNLTMVDAESNINGLANAAVNAGYPTLGSTGKYFTSKSLTFIQTKADNSGEEAWTVAVGLPTSGYSVTNANGVKVYTGGLFAQTDANSITAIVITKDATTVKEAPKTEFLYILSVNGQVDKTSTGAPVFEVSVYNSTTNAVETLQAVGSLAPKQIWKAYTASTKTFSDSISITADSTNAGFIKTFSDNVIGLEKVTAKGTEQANPVTTVAAFVVDKDTRYYVIDGDKSTELDASEVGTQPTLDWGTDPTTKADVKYYQTIIIADDNGIATHVITFATEQTFPAAN